MLESLLRALVSLPALLALPAALGLALLRRRRRTGMAAIAVSAALLYALACPWFGAALLRSQQVHPALSPQLTRSELRAAAQAIVVLAAGHNRAAPEYGLAGVDALTLERLRYAAELARRSDLPVLTSGGVPESGAPPLSEAMRGVLRHDWQVETRWTETRSADTRGNARESAALLRADGIERVFLVTHAWHMSRALAAFRAAGLDPIAAPTAFRAPPRPEWRAFWPSAKGLHESSWAWHEIVGRVWYALRG